MAGRDLNKGYYTREPMASSEYKPWNKERTAGRVQAVRNEIPPAGQAKLWAMPPGTGNTCDQYAHWRAKGDIYNDGYFGRSAQNFQPPLLSDASTRAAGKPGDKGGHKIILPSL